jgi:hypothetical protein
MLLSDLDGARTIKAAGTVRRAASRQRVLVAPPYPGPIVRYRVHLSPRGRNQPAFSSYRRECDRHLLMYRNLV